MFHIVWYGHNKCFQGDKQMADFDIRISDSGRRTADLRYSDGTWTNSPNDGDVGGGSSRPLNYRAADETHFQQVDMRDGLGLKDYQTPSAKLLNDANRAISNYIIPELERITAEQGIDPSLFFPKGEEFVQNVFKNDQIMIPNVPPDVSVSEFIITQARIGASSLITETHGGQPPSQEEYVSKAYSAITDIIGRIIIEQNKQVIDTAIRASVVGFNVQIYDYIGCNPLMEFPIEDLVTGNNQLQKEMAQSIYIPLFKGLRSIVENSSKFLLEEFLKCYPPEEYSGSNWEKLLGKGNCTDV